MAQKIPDNTEKYTYPWDRLTTELEDGSINYLPIAGFGSLLNTISAQRTFSNAPAPARPLKVFGFQRVYDYYVRSERYDKYGANFASYHPCALNCYPSPGHWLNAVELQLTRELLEGFRTREKFYDLLPARACAWQDTGHEDLQPDRTVWILSKKPVDHEAPALMYPHPHYHSVCCKGAFDVSESFLDAFYKTTWLVDRQTGIGEKMSPCKNLIRNIKL